MITDTGAVRLVSAGHPEGDVVFMSIDSNANPGGLKRAILKELGLSEELLPTPERLSAGYAFVTPEKGPVLCFVVTVQAGTRERDTQVLLVRNLTAAVASMSGSPGASIWMPLMGMGAGGLTALESFKVTLEAVFPFLYRLSVTISIPPEVRERELSALHQYLEEYRNRPDPLQPESIAKAFSRATPEQTGRVPAPDATAADPGGRRPVLDNDLIVIGDGAEDALGTQSEADAFARVAISQATRPPLAIGVFGDWGAGKSTFMERMSHKVKALGRSKDNKVYCAEAVEVKFNAWHYIESNLWASLAENIFSCLGEHLRKDPNVGADGVKKLFGKLATPQRLELENAERVVEARRQLQAAQQHLGQVEAELRSAPPHIGPAVMFEAGVAAIRAAVPKEKLDKDLARLRESMDESGLSGAAAATDDLLKEMQKASRLTARFVLTVRKLVQDGEGRARLLIWLVVALILIYVCDKGVEWIIDELPVSKSKSLIQTVAKAISSIAAVLVSFNLIAHKAIATVGRLVHTAREVRREVMAKVTASRAAQIDKVDAARRSVASAEERLSLAKQDFKRSSPEARLNEFIRAKAEGDEYTKHLGIVAMIRKDFDQLSQIMCGSQGQTVGIDHYRNETLERYGQELRNEGLIGEKIREGDDPREAADELDKLHFFDRIVLYIDDLDRCKPERVVEVLQAVHLLLAFPLFVVVVAVDYRWVSSALRAHYRGQLADADPLSAPKPGERADETRSGFASPEDYIEKIFQIPYWVRPVSPLAASGLIREYTQRGDKPGETASTERFDGQPENVIDESHVPLVREGENAGGGAEKKPPQEFTSVVEPSPKNTDDEAVILDPLEITFMEQVAQIAGVTPRRLKRFVNTYRVIKATLHAPDDETGANLLAPNEGAPRYKAILVQLALATGHADAFAGYAAELAHTAGKHGNLGMLIERMRHGSIALSAWEAHFLDVLQSLYKDHPDSHMVTTMFELVGFVARFSFSNPQSIRRSNVVTSSPPLAQPVPG